MANDVDIVLGVAVAGVKDVYNLSNAMQQLNRTVAGAVNPMRSLDARARALSQAIGSSDSSLKNHAKTVSQLATNNAILTNELNRVRKEIAGMGTQYKLASGASSQWSKAAIGDLKAYESELKKVRIRALTEDLKHLSQEQKRLGKDAQFVGRSLIIGLTTPIMGFARVGLQSLVAIDKEFVRLNKVLENVAPNIDYAAKKMGVDLTKATASQNDQMRTMVNNYNELNKALTSVSTKFGLSKSLTVGLAGDFAELGIQSTKSLAQITELTAATEKLGDMDITAAKNLVQSLYFQAQRAMQQSGQARTMTFQEREVAAINAATAQLNMFNAVENVTALTLRDLGDAFPEVAAAATSFGLSMTEAAGMLAPMKAAGFEVGASANSIKVSLQRIVAPTKANAELLASLSKQYGLNFNIIKGTGLDAIQALIDAFNKLQDTAAGQEGIMQFFAKIFGVRQGPRMETAIAQMAEFDRILKNSSGNLDSAEKRLQGFANAAISSANKSKNVNLPVIQSYKDIGIIARIAAAQIKEGETAQIDGFGRVTAEQVRAARNVRDAVSKEIVKAQQTRGEDLIGQVGTEAGRAMFVELAGAANASQVAQRELESALGSLDTQLSILKNNFRMFAADLLTQLKPAFEKIADVTTRLYNSWMNLSPEVRSLVSTVVIGFAAITASIGPLVFVFGQFRLAMGTIGKVLFGFLPGLKSMTVETVAARSAMLRLKNPLVAVGDTIVNTNSKFSTFIATMASGEGPVARLAKRFGEMSGILSKTGTTAQASVTRRVFQRMSEREGVGLAEIQALGGYGVTKQQTPTLSRLMRKGGTGLFDPNAPLRQLTASEMSKFRTEERLTKDLLGVSRTPSGQYTGRAGGVFGRGFISRAKLDDEAMSEIIFRRQEALQKAGIRTSATGQRFFTTRFGGAGQITEDQATSLMRGGLRGRLTRAGMEGGALRENLITGIKGAPGKAVDTYKNALDNARKAQKALQIESLAMGEGVPGRFASMRSAVMGFAKSFKSVQIAINLTKMALVTSGIGVLVLAIGVAVMLVMKNMDKFKSSASGGLKVIKQAFDIFKNAVMEVIRPIIDLFKHFGNGSEGAAGAVEGIGNSFNKVANVIKWVATMFAMLVEKFVKPYMYMIINIVGAVVSLFQGKWKKAFSFLGAAVAFATEIWVNLFSLAFKIVIKAAAGLVKGIINLLGMLGKAAVELVLSPITLILSAATKLPLGIGNKFKGVYNSFRGVVNGAKGMVDTATGAVNSVVDSAANGTNRLIDKASGGIKNKIKGLKKGGIDASTGKITLGGGKKPTPDVDTDPMQEQIANSTGKGIEEGAKAGAKALAQAFKDIKRELQDEIANKIKDAIQGVVESITNAMKAQRDQSLAVYDAQIKKIEDTAQAEEELTKKIEYENKRREEEEKRALNRQKFQRDYALAIYQGRIDDARVLSQENAQNEINSNRAIGEIDKDRAKYLAEQNRKNLIDSIKEAKDKAKEYFDDMINSFTEAAKKITEFPPTTAKEFADQLAALGVVANEKANAIGTSFSASFSGALANLGVNSSGPLTSALESISKILTDNNPFGPNGVWSRTIDTAIDYLTRKYSGLNNTLTTIIDTKSQAFQTLLSTYQRYKDLTSTDTTGVGGGNESAGSGGVGGSGSGGAYITQLPQKKGKVSPMQMAQVLLSNYRGADGALIFNYLTDAFEKVVKNKYESASNNYKKFLNENPNLKNSKNVNIARIVSNLYNLGSTAGGYNGYKLYEIGGVIPFMKGGLTIGPLQQSIPAMLHGGEYVIRNSAVKKYGWGMMQQINQGTYKPKPILTGGEYFINPNAVRNIGYTAMQAMNNMRFMTPKSPSYSGGVGGSGASSSTVHIYVDNFIGERAWFESMMKDYNVKVVPQNQKAAGINNTTISTYTGLNRGL